MTAELRPRSDWEAIDLGLALVRRDFWSLSSIWLLGMSPMLLPAIWLLPEHPVWFCLVFWWWIPVASRLVLFKLSRRLFGDDPSKREVLREFPKAISRRFLFRMFWARLSPWRPLTMPVEDLEGLKGKAYSARCRVLMRRGDSSVILLAMWRLFLSFWMAVTILFTVALFIPDGSGQGWSESITLWLQGEKVVPPTSLSIMVIGSICCALGLVDIFSIGAGFGIYVNHRTWIEGWDVELAFRRLGNRLLGITSLLVFGLMGSLVMPADAANGAEVIEEVLDHEDFEVHKETIRTPKWDWLENWSSGSGSSSGSGGGSGVGGGLLEGLAVILKVGLIGGLLVLLAWLIYRYRHVFSRGSGGGGRIAKPQAKVVMGMAVAPESLPEDVSDTALRLWNEGQRHEAMSLLYRASISWMINQGGLEIAESDTESDCLRRAGQAEVRHLSYFDGLTRRWMSLAYAREAPSESDWERLCREWPFSERRVK
ncbi:DUF4129 domain-containing protein [Haloferula chungangensis]|uniref:DUF4129 domain-containing protein n=1 Tax=Haloferula chungangensis TaxID=1048331 RepID=UPI0036D31EF1